MFQIKDEGKTRFGLTFRKSSDEKQHIVVKKPYFGEDSTFGGFRRRFQSPAATVADYEVGGAWQTSALFRPRGVPENAKSQAAQKPGNPRVVHTKGHRLDPGLGLNYSGLELGWVA